MASNLLSTPPPLAPPQTSGCTASWLRLIRSHRVGVSTFFRLMDEHGSAQAALEALPQIASKAGVAKYTPCSLEVAERELDHGRRIGATLVAYGSDTYPSTLYDLPDPPPLFWALGQVELLHRPSIAMVGARNASSLGMRMARTLSSALGDAGLVITSGLARGIDASCHSASLHSGTIAVQAGGVDTIYPSENAELHKEIARHGLRLSEQPLGMTPRARDFPKRNRIISGLSRALIVVEAAGRSGSLITARNALDQGRDVLAVPGHPFDGRSSGCNMLIRDGATLIRGARDVLEALDWHETHPETPAPETECAKPPEQNLGTDTDLDDAILALLGPTATAEDQLIRDLGTTAARVSPRLTHLELDGRIQRHPGGLLSRT